MDYTDLANRAAALVVQHQLEGCAYAQQGEPHRCNQLVQLRHLRNAAQTIEELYPLYKHELSTVKYRTVKE